MDPLRAAWLCCALMRGLEDFVPTNKLEQRIAAVLAERVRPTAEELLELIRQINPTGRELQAAVTRRRYQLKSQLQSLLVRRFEADLEIVPEPHQAGVVRLRHRYLDRGGAAHAVVAELEADARSLVQRHLDTMGSVEETAAQPPGTGTAPGEGRSPAPLSVPPEPAEPADDAPWPELVRQGQAAVADYDYEAGRALLELGLARSGGALEAARPLLELLVEVLAAYDDALALAPELSAEATADPSLRALLAQATAHSRPCESVQAEVERWLRGAAPSDAVGVWVVLVERALRAGEEAMATGGLEQARTLGASPSELLRLEGELQALRRSRWHRVEAELLQALSQGRLADAEPTARELLAKWPESPAARRVLALLQEQRRQHERERLLADAEAALERGDFERAAERSHAARALGGQTADLDSRIERARAEAQRQRDREQVERVTARLTAGAADDTALLLYLQLPPRLRSEAQKLAGLPQLDWLEQAGAPSTGARAQAAVEAVQALLRCAGSADADPSAVLSTLGPYEAVLERVGRFRELVASAHAARAARRHQQALEQLEEARAALHGGEIERAGRLLQEIDPHALAGREREQARALEAQIRRRTEARRRAEEVQRRLAAEDLLGALEESDALLELCDEDRADAETRRAGIAALLQRAYCVRELRLDTEGEPLPGLGELGVLGGVLAPEARQLPISTAVRGNEATIATSYGRWLFLWTVALDVPRLLRVVRLRTPAPLGEQLQVVAASDRLWIVGRMHVLALDPAGAQIRFWRPLADFLGPDGFADDAFVLPEAGYLWLLPALQETNRAVVVDLRRWRLRREVPLGPRVKPVLGGQEPLLASYGLGHEVRLFAADGSTRDRLTYPSGKVADLSLPGGAGPLLALCVERDDEDESALAAPADLTAPSETPFVAMGLAEPGSADWSVPLSSPHADGQHLLTAAREHDLTIVAYKLQEGPLRLYGLSRRGNALRRRWKAESLGGFLCLQDPARRRAFALFPTTDGCGLTELGPGAPERLSQSTDYEHRLPRLSGPFLCDTVGLQIPSPVMQQLSRVPFIPRAEVGPFLAALRAKHAGDPSALLAMTDFTPGKQRAEHAEFIRARFPEHPLLPMRLADAAAQDNSWQAAAEALRHVQIDLLPERGRRHALHLLGIVRLRGGDLDGAEQAFTQAAQSPGQCTIDRCLAWLSALRQPPEPPELIERTADPSFCGMLVRLLRMVDSLLEHGAPEAAVRALEHPMIWALEERQTLARLTAAYLRLSPSGGLPLFHKTLALARFCAWHEEPFLADNLCLLGATWDDETLGTLYQEAEAWLAALSAWGSNPSLGPLGAESDKEGPGADP